jgi:hypothetical protein
MSKIDDTKDNNTQYLNAVKEMKSIFLIYAILIGVIFLSCNKRENNIRYVKNS